MAARQSISALLAGRQKLIVISVFSCVWATILLVWLRSGIDETQLDSSWWLGLIAMFQQGNISGRDFQFTYGPFGQFVAWVGTLLTSTHSAFDSLSMCFFVVDCVGIVLIGLSLLVIDRITWRRTAFIYISMLALRIFCDAPAYRVAFLVLCCALAYRTVSEKCERRQLMWAAATGGCCFLAQTATPEAGLFGLVAATVVVSLAAYRSRNTRLGLKSLLALISTFLFANVCVGVMFRFSSSTYESLFAYQKYALATMTGYQNVMGTPWALGSWPTIVLIALAAWVVISAIRSWRVCDFNERFLVVSLTIGSILSLRSAFTRSDDGHIAYGFTPLVLTFLLTGPKAMRFKYNYLNVACWMVLYIALLSTWPFTSVYAFTDSAAIVTGRIPIAQVWNRFRAPAVHSVDLLPEILVTQAKERPAVPVLAFPYQNYIPILLNRPMVAPVLQHYSAGTVSLQDFYVRDLERRRKDGMEVIYAIDDLSARPVDGVPAVTRTPKIFEYLYRNFALASDGVRPGNFYWLRPRSSSREAEIADLPFKLERENRNTLRVKLASPVSCGLTKVEMRIDYPFAGQILRPNGLRYEFLLSDQPVAKWDMRPLAIGTEFTTILPTVKAVDFYKLFGSGTAPALTWDSIRFDVPAGGRLSVNPSYVDVRKVECMDLSRFVPATNAPAETSNAISDSQPIAIGYAKIAADSNATPLVSGRFSFSSNTTERFSPSLTTEAVLDLKGSDPVVVGVALANPGSLPNVIELMTEDATGKVLRRTTVSLKPAMHLAKFASELLPMDGIAVALRCRAKRPFGIVALEVAHSRVRLIAKQDSVRLNDATIFPHFVSNGGWGTEIVLSNPSKKVMTGIVQLRSSTGEPMLVTIDGKTATEFPYTIAAGGTVVLAAGSSAR